MAFADAIAMTIGLSLFGSNSLKVENWAPELGVSQNQTMEIAVQAADVASQSFEKAKGCSGKLISVFVTPTSLKRSKTATAFKLNYQLSYSRSECSNKLMIDCSIEVIRQANTISSQNHVCKNYPLKDYGTGSSSSSKQGQNDMDSRDEFSSNTHDDGINEPSRPGSDFDNSRDMNF